MEYVTIVDLFKRYGLRYFEEWHAVVTTQSFIYKGIIDSVIPVEDKFVVVIKKVSKRNSQHLKFENSEDLELSLFYEYNVTIYQMGHQFYFNLPQAESMRLIEHD
jgi:hypothetical protein